MIAWLVLAYMEMLILELLATRYTMAKKVEFVVYENGQGVIEDNEIYGNTLSGVDIKEGGNPTLRRNKIHDGKKVEFMFTKMVRA